MVFNQHPHSGFALHRDQMMMTGIWVINGRTLMRMQSCIGLSPRMASLTFLVKTLNLTVEYAFQLEAYI